MLSNPNAQLLARAASQQHSVRRLSGMTGPIGPGLQQPPPGAADAAPSPAAPAKQQQVCSSDNVIIALRYIPNARTSH